MFCVRIILALQTIELRSQRIKTWSVTIIHWSTSMLIPSRTQFLRLQSYSPILLWVTAREPRRNADIAAQSNFQIWIKMFPFCRANIFTYKTKFLDLKDEFWLRYENPIKSTQNWFLVVRKIFMNFFLNCFLDISPSAHDRVLKFLPPMQFDMENTTSIFNKIHAVNKYH